MKPIRQGDVLLTQAKKIQGQKLNHLILAEGEATGHKHRIAEGQAELYEEEGRLYLKVLSEKALLAHEEHKEIAVPKGIWKVRIQREYEPDGTFIHQKTSRSTASKNYRTSYFTCRQKML